MVNVEMTPQIMDEPAAVAAAERLQHDEDCRECLDEAKAVAARCG